MGAFVPFLLLMISILSLINIIAVQARVHYAMTQAANTISMYSYALELLGVANDLTALDEKAYRADSAVSEIKDGIDAVLNMARGAEGTGDMSGGGGSISRALEQGEQLLGDPKETLGMFVSYGLDHLWDMLFDELARPLVGRYLSNGDMTGDEYLRACGALNRKTGAKGLAALEFYNHADRNLGRSSLIDRNGNVKLVVEYEIAYTFWSLELPFKPTLRIAQTVSTKAWLNGSGKGYW